MLVWVRLYDIFSKKLNSLYICIHSKLLRVIAAIKAPALQALSLIHELRCVALFEAGRPLRINSSTFRLHQSSIWTDWGICNCYRTDSYSRSVWQNRKVRWVTGIDRTSNNYSLLWAIYKSEGTVGVEKALCFRSVSITSTRKPCICPKLTSV